MSPARAETRRVRPAAVPSAEVASAPGAPVPVAPRVGLVGYFGWGNFGDELMFRLWQDAFRGLATTESVHSLLRRPYFSEPADSVVRRYDALVVGGGDLVVPGSISSLYWNRAWLRRPVVVAGIGVALESSRSRPDVLDRLHGFFSHASVRAVSARDGGSAEWIQRELRPSVPVTVTADLAFAYALPEVGEGSPDRVGIVLRKRPSDEDRHRVERIRSWANRQGLEAELLALADGSTLAEELEGIGESFGAEQRVRTCTSVDEMCRVIGGYRCLFTAKFHGAVIAARYGVPAFSLRRTHKMRSLADQLADPRLIHDPAELTDEQLWSAAHRPVPVEAVRAAELSARRAVLRTVATATPD